MQSRAGFTLIEIIVTVSVIAILSAVIFPSLNEGSAQARDAQRKADLRALQGAVELYREEYGRYPEGCNNTADDVGEKNAWEGHEDFWSGEAGNGYACSPASNAYIVGLAPEFIPQLPTDPRLNSDFPNSGYVYITNPAGTVYKIMALNTVETEVMTAAEDTRDNPFSRCGDLLTDRLNICGSSPSGPRSLSGNPLFKCGNDPDHVEDYVNDFAVYGGYAPGGGASRYWDTAVAKEFYSDSVHCR